ncbi:MAG: stress response translation initiation inhibitor YciH [Gammaproteobacteria bacterium]|nr:stress response translation initiation inhibitor YciH [Gammaproteobacteria bacterium]
MSTKNSRLVYSTDSGRITESVVSKTVQGDGIVRIRRETKGRKGKGVTTLSGFSMSESELKVLAKQLKQKCSTGGTVKDGMIEIQGDHREILKIELEKRGLTAKLAGG